MAYSQQMAPMLQSQQRFPDTSGSSRLLQRSPLAAWPAERGREAEQLAPSIVRGVLSSGGQPLDAETRDDMEARLGHNFGDVRIHADGRADESARAVCARAYTVGQQIAFAAGQFDPRSRHGRQLLAHELSHVVQQRAYGPWTGSEIRVGAVDDPFEREAEHNAAQVASYSPRAPARLSAAPPLLQREGEPGQRSDVSLVLDADEKDMDEGRAYAARVIRVTSPEDARKKLQALGLPIGTLFIVSHANRAGEVKFESQSGTLSWVKISELGKQLKGALPADKAPATVDFRGCKLGEAEGQLESFRQQVGAKVARAGNCWSFTQRVTPLTVGGTDITQESQIPKGMEKAFDAALRQQVNGLKAANGRSVKDCLIGLAPGEKADKSFTKIRQLYFRNGGTLVAGWASPEYNEEWQEGSICTKDMTESTSPCRIVKAVASDQEGKQSMLTIEAPDMRLAGDASGVFREEFAA